jgi:hypothetical protein
MCYYERNQTVAVLLLEQICVIDGDVQRGKKGKEEEYEEKSIIDRVVLHDGGGFCRRVQQGW